MDLNEHFFSQETAQRIAPGETNDAHIIAKIMNEALDLGLKFDKYSEPSIIDSANVEDVPPSPHRELERRPVAGQLKEPEDVRRKREAVFAAASKNLTTEAKKFKYNLTTTQCSRIIGKVFSILLSMLANFYTYLVMRLLSLGWIFC